MQMVAAVVHRQKPVWIAWIANGGSKIDDAIESSARPNPTVNHLSLRLTFVAVVVGTLVGRKRATEDFDTVGVRSTNDLLQACDQLLRSYFLRLVGSGLMRPAQIIDAFEHDHVLHSVSHEHVAIQPL